MSRDYMASAAQYQADVLSGAIPACQWVRLACARNRRDLDRQRTDEFPYYFDSAAGSLICQFAEMLPHVKGPKAFIVSYDEEERPIWNTLVLEGWQCWLLATIFGWKRVVDGLRRFRVAFPLVPRKNAKSTIGAVVVLFMLTVEGESGAECYSAATTRDQAKAVAEIAWEMAKRSPALRDAFGLRVGSETSRSLSVPATAGKFLPLSADANSLDGLNVSLAVIDELHAHKTRGVWDVLDTATGARLQPLLLPITTAGVSSGGICYEKLIYLQKVLTGAVADETWFGVYYTIDEGDDWRLPAVQRKANPNYGVSVQPDDLARKALAAEQSSAAIGNYLTKHCNVWVGAEAGWMTSATWQACRKASGLTVADLKQYPCWIGIDLAEARDIAAMVALFRIADDHYAAVGRFYLPEAAIVKSPIAQMSGFVRDGHIIQTPGNQADFRRIENDIVAWVDEIGTVQEIDFDRALAAQMSQSLKARFLPRMGDDAVENFVVTVPQDTPTMDAAMKMTERLVIGHGFEHDGNPAMAWMISNVVVKRTETTDEIRPSKAGGKDSPNKIDGPVALFTAMARAMAYTGPGGEYADPEWVDMSEFE